MDLGDVGARGEAHGVAGRGHGSPGVCRRRELHVLGSKAAAAAVALLVLLVLGDRGVLLGSRRVLLVLHVGHCEEEGALVGSLEKDR